MPRINTYTLHALPTEDSKFNCLICWPHGAKNAIWNYVWGFRELLNNSLRGSLVMSVLRFSKSGNLYNFQGVGGACLSHGRAQGHDNHIA